MGMNHMALRVDEEILELDEKLKRISENVVKDN